MLARNDEGMPRAVRPRIWTDLVLNDAYKIGALIEQGSATEIYDGTELSTGEKVAIKILLPQLADDQKIRALFLDEARILTRLSHPGLLHYRACAHDPRSGLTYIITETIGPRLSTRLGSLKPSAKEILTFSKRLVHALASAHQAGLVHGRLSPSTIMLPEGRLIHAKIIGFSSVKARRQEGAPAFDDTAGNLAYLAPEQAGVDREETVIGPYTDIYSFARVVSAVARRGAPGAGREADLAALPKKLRPVFARMLEFDPARRFRTMDEVLEKLDGLVLDTDALKDSGESVKRTAWPNVLKLHRSEAKDEPAPVRAPAPAPAPAPKAPAPAPFVLPPTLQPAKSEAPKPIAFKTRPIQSEASGRKIAVRAAVGAFALLIAATPWLLQMVLPESDDGRAAVAEARQPVKAAVQTPVDEPLPAGRVYGAENAASRFTLRLHRATRVTVFSKGKQLLFSRNLARGDVYRAPNLPDLTINTPDSGAVEVVFDGKSTGFVGEDGVQAQGMPLRRFPAFVPKPAAPKRPAAPMIAAKEPAAPASIEAPPPAAPAPAEVTSIAPRFVEQPAQASVPEVTVAAPDVAPVEQAIVEEPEPPTSAIRRPEPAIAAAPEEQPAATEETAPERPGWVRSRLQRLFSRSDSKSEPPLSKEAAERAEKAAEVARAARETVNQKAAEDARARNRAFYNSTLGIGPR